VALRTWVSIPKWSYAGGYDPNPWVQIMAMSTLVTLPALLVFFFAQRTFIQGIVFTGVKG